MSAKYSGGYTEFGGGDRRIVGGYIKLVEGMLEELAGKVNFKLNHVVNQVEFCINKSFVRGKFLENSFELIGDCTVISVPLGVLQAKSIRFTPELPLTKLNSIEKMGYGKLLPINHCKWLQGY
jgi:hypothetical protein